MGSLETCPGLVRLEIELRLPTTVASATVVALRTVAADQAVDAVNQPRQHAVSPPFLVFNRPDYSGLY